MSRPASSAPVMTIANQGSVPSRARKTGISRHLPTRLARHGTTTDTPLLPRCQVRPAFYRRNYPSRVQSGFPWHMPPAHARLKAKRDRRGMPTRVDTGAPTGSSCRRLSQVVPPFTDLQLSLSTGLCRTSCRRIDRGPTCRRSDRRRRSRGPRTLPPTQGSRSR